MTDSPTVNDRGLSLLRTFCLVLLVIVSVILSCCVFGLVLSTTAPVEVYSDIWNQLTAQLPAGTMDTLYDIFDTLTNGALYESFIRTLVTAVLVAAVAVLTFLLAVFLVVLSALKTLKENFHGQLSYRKFPMVLIVLWYIIGVCGGIGVLFSLDLFFEVSLYQTASTAAAWFMLAKRMHSYRKKTDALRAHMISE